MKVNFQSLIKDMENIEKEKKPSDFDSHEEAQHLVDIINNDTTVSSRLELYSHPIVKGVGGSGLIIRAIYKPTDSPRALKFPRHRLYKSVPITGAVNDVKQPIDVDPELHALEKISHQNITRLYEAFALPTGHSY